MAFDREGLDDYIDVAQRLADFREQYPQGSLQPADPAQPWQQAIVTGYRKDGQEFTATMIVYMAAAYRTPDDPRPGIGIAWEVFPGRTPYTAGSELMNAETSAWGRAIVAALAGDTKRGVSSRQEVRNRVAEREDGLPTNRDGSLSRSRTTDAEKAAAGVMTSAQLAEHTALRPKSSWRADRPAVVVVVGAVVSGGGAAAGRAAGAGLSHHGRRCRFDGRVMSGHVAKVEVLTAEVRVLMVNSRQVTLSVYAQLDQVSPGEITPFGRVRTRNESYWLAIVGIDREGILCGSHIRRWKPIYNGPWRFSWPPEFKAEIGSDFIEEWEALPLIVLAGLR